MRFTSAHADLITAIVFFAIGTAMLIGGYTMDRLAFRAIHPASIPGLLPMFLGGALMVCAVLLALSTRGRRVAEDPDHPSAGDGGTSWHNLLVATVMCVVYAVILVGWLPFFLATAIFIAGFIFTFSAPFSGATRRTALVAVFSVLFGAVMAAGISGLFQYGFLVRLP